MGFFLGYLVPKKEPINWCHLLCDRWTAEPAVYGHVMDSSVCQFPPNVLNFSPTLTFNLKRPKVIYLHPVTDDTSWPYLCQFSEEKCPKKCFLTFQWPWLLTLRPPKLTICSQHYQLQNDTSWTSQGQFCLEIRRKKISSLAEENKIHIMTIYESDRVIMWNVVTWYITEWSYKLQWGLSKTPIILQPVVALLLYLFLTVCGSSGSNPQFKLLLPVEKRSNVLTYSDLPPERTK